MHSSIKARSLVGALNTRLPKDVRVLDAYAVPDDFHARYSVMHKTYRYSFYRAPIIPPPFARYALPYRLTAPLDHLNRASAELIGTHDFSPFCRKATYKTPIRTLSRFDWQEEGNYIHVYLTANGFLRGMVRLLVGTLITRFSSSRLGERMRKKSLLHILQEKDRQCIGPSLPAHALFLYQVQYKEQFDAVFREREQE